MHTNDLPAARAAGRLMTEAEKAAQEKFEEEEKKRQEEEEAQMSAGMKALNYVGNLFSYGASFLGQMIDPVVDGPAAGVVEADVDKVDCHKHPHNQYSIWRKDHRRSVSTTYRQSAPATGRPAAARSQPQSPECDHRR
ncbi:hypothetical protein O5900_07110 [Escherichia fergusonii]|nr:hypothetical protein [Escherichia fergusonii]MCZ5215078.1 hypothetical protein [Escherichia fergusonii]